MNYLPGLVLTLTIGAPITKEAPKKPVPPSIVGEWELVACIAGGRTATEQELEQIQMSLKFEADGACRFTEGTRKGPRTRDGKYTTDPSKDPAQIDFLSEKGKPARRIYKIEKGQLIICGAEGDGDRPTKFESPPGTRIMLMTFARVEKKKD